MIVQRLPKRISATIEIIFFLIIIILVGILARSSYIMVLTQSSRRYSPTLGISMFWVEIILPVGFALTLIHSLFIILEDIKKLLTGKS
jgi:TRAP-type C4-dicarboxylate transport system permease small subunit